MNRTANSIGAKEARLLGFALTTALASATLSGCAASAPPAELSASKAENALAQGKQSSAISHAEAAVLADPRNAAYRAMLGAAYLDSGRFASAATSFDDAMALGDNSPRTALSLALALSADGKGREAVAVLNDWENEIAPADVGLAFALAGEPDRGVRILSDTLRSGQNTAKVRQNLAYSYALAGRWREARLMAAEDVPAAQLGERIAEWSVDANPRAYEFRVAKLLAVPFNQSDSGQPAQLALSLTPGAEQLAAEASANAIPAPPPPPAQAVGAIELPPVGDPVDPQLAASSYQSPEAVAPRNFQAAFTAPAPAPAAKSSVVMDSSGFVQDTAKPRPAAKPAPKKRGTVAAAPQAASAPASEGTHLVQLGSFSSEQGARRAWGIYAKRYPELSDHQMVITEAVVRGKRYFRVSAAGYDASSSRSMCSRVKRASSEGCFAYAESSPLPGAVDNGRRFASR